VSVLVLLRFTVRTRTGIAPRILNVSQAQLKSSQENNLQSRGFVRSSRRWLLSDDRALLYHRGRCD